MYIPTKGVPMNIHRIDGIKYNLDRLHTEEIEKLVAIVTNKVKDLMVDVTILESVLLDRQLLKLPFKDEDE